MSGCCSSTLFNDYYRIRSVRQKLKKNKTYAQWVTYHEEENDL